MDGGSLSGTARIGPNAILQLVPVLDRAMGEARRHLLFEAAAVPLPPPDAGMLPEDQVIRLHRAIVQVLPDLAPDLMRAAGLATAEYILANRIPAVARAVIRALPKPLGARLLAKAVAKHAWTFAGSGVFRIVGYRPLTVSIVQNPLAVGVAQSPSCHWHAAVFERLFATLVWPDVRVREIACCAAGDLACMFEIVP
ncbi:MAG: bacteriochlorophyll 4-vinyl reductase [Paracoccaceae bacterium]